MTFRAYIFCVLFMAFVGHTEISIACDSSAVRDQAKEVETLYQVKIDEVERESYKQILDARSEQGGERIPDAPFGFRQKAWEDFKNKIKPGDCLMYFSTNTESWEQLRGRSGYLILRSREIVDVFIVSLS